MNTPTFGTKNPNKMPPLPAGAVLKLIDELLQEEDPYGTVAMAFKLRKHFDQFAYKQVWFLCESQTCNHEFTIARVSLKDAHDKYQCGNTGLKCPVCQCNTVQVDGLGYVKLSRTPVKFGSYPTK